MIIELRCCADANDAPTLQSPPSINVPENAAINSTIYTLLIADDDILSSHDYVVWSGRSSTWDNQNINRSGVIIGNAFSTAASQPFTRAVPLLPLTLLDFETKSRFRLALQVADTYSRLPYLINITLFVNITLIDLNDPPERYPVPLWLNTSENVPIGTVVVPVLGFDQDVSDTCKRFDMTPCCI